MARSELSRTIPGVDEPTYIFLPSGVLSEVLDQYRVLKHRHAEGEPGAVTVLVDLLVERGGEVATWKQVKELHDDPKETRCVFFVGSRQIQQRVKRSGRRRFGWSVVSQYRKGRAGLLVGLDEYEAAKNAEVRHAG